MDSLEILQQALRCGHCGSVFAGTYRQAKSVKYEDAAVYCSKICRDAALRALYRKRSGSDMRGPCPTCGKRFHSSNPKKMFCSMKCYTNSAQFRAMLKGNVEKCRTPVIKEKQASALRTGEVNPCPHCGAGVYRKASQKRNGRKRFCSSVCYRAYFSARFDRWVANPQELALPQCYDEFLSAEELPCLVDGCGWKGPWLTLHMNQAHGVTTEEFKRAAGFNMGTGVIGTGLATSLSRRAKAGIALYESQDDALALARAALQSRRDAGIKQYVSLEAKEHRKKAAALRTG